MLGDISQLTLYVHVCMYVQYVQSLGKIVIMFTIWSRVGNMQILNSVLYNWKKQQTYLHTDPTTCTVGPRLSGHQLSGYLYYPAMILQYTLSYFN